MTQREKPGIAPEGCAPAMGPPYFSGGQFENFRAGWATNVDPDHYIAKAHYYRRENTSYAVSLCGRRGAARWLYGAGNWPRCRKCAALASRHG
ncbi:MAG: hypothetical protein HY749_15960 [Gammaproteobacteria bacterium]|nr:hypothetical protein [Gammaproteobacteria bacterium]